MKVSSALKVIPSSKVIQLSIVITNDLARPFFISVLIVSLNYRLFIYSEAVFILLFDCDLLHFYW